MIRQLPIFLLISTLIACKTSSPKTSIPKVKETNQVSIEGTKIEDFVGFINLQKGDTLKGALKLFGTPTKSIERQKKDAFITNVYKDEKDSVLLSYAYYKNNKKLNHIRVSGNSETDFTSTKDFFKSKGVADAKIHFLGSHKDTIQKILGKPYKVRNNYHYFNSGGTIIAFKCDTTENRCTEIYMFWSHYFN